MNVAKLIYFFFKTDNYKRKLHRNAEPKNKKIF